jgi:hypothetical protein
MDPRPPLSPPPPPPHSPQYTAPLAYQSPGAHQKSQWITDDEGIRGRLLVGCLILGSVVAAVVGGIVTAAWFFLGW